MAELLIDWATVVARRCTSRKRYIATSIKPSLCLSITRGESFLRCNNNKTSQSISTSNPIVPSCGLTETQTVVLMDTSDNHLSLRNSATRVNTFFFFLLQMFTHVGRSSRKYNTEFVTHLSLYFDNAWAAPNECLCGTVF